MHKVNEDLSWNEAIHWGPVSVPPPPLKLSSPLPQSHALQRTVNFHRIWIANDRHDWSLALIHNITFIPFPRLLRNAFNCIRFLAKLIKAIIINHRNEFDVLLLFKSMQTSLSFNLFWFTFLNSVTMFYQSSCDSHLQDLISTFRAKTSRLYFLSSSQHLF